MQALHGPSLQRSAPSAAGPLALTLAGLDAWFETMRGPGGYGGPVAHWWRQSLLYTGPGLDWRYEGIVDGYVTLWERFGESRWLAKARRAGDDLLGGQSPDGHYAASAFEINPATGGTPHEAACDAALLRLALALRAAGEQGWACYAEAAERNIASYLLGRLWGEGMAAIRDSPDGAAFVPNKACTAVEAIFLLADLRGDDALVERYGLPTLERVLAHQVRGGALDGAIAQNSFGGRVVEKYIPIYIARCVPALLRAHRYSGCERWLDGALRAGGFLARRLTADGRVPTVVYLSGSVNSWPAWVAPLGDVLRAADLLRPYGLSADFRAVEARMLAGGQPSGAIATAEGFAAQHGGCPGSLPDFRDLLGVAGWCDKAFRYLASHCAGPVPPVASQPTQTVCTLGGRRYDYFESSNVLELRRRGRARYRWVKGESWAASAPELWTG